MVVVYASHSGPRGVMERLALVSDEVIVSLARRWCEEVRPHKALASYVKYFDTHCHLKWAQRENAIQCLSERGHTLETFLNAAGISLPAPGTG